MTSSLSLLAALAMDSDAITEFLGIVAVGAFLLVAIWVLVTFLKESATQKSVMAVQAEEARASELDRANSSKDLFELEVRKLEEEYNQFFDETIAVCKTKLGELVVNARSSLGKVAGAYARVSKNPDGEHADAIKARFAKVCETQWGGFKAEIGYVGFPDLEPQLRLVLNAHEMLSQAASGQSEDYLEMSPSLMRLNEVILLQQAMNSERMGNFQMEAMESVEPFKRYYNKCVKDWLSDRIFSLVQKLREKKARGASIRDTELKGRFVRLKNLLETFSQLSERFESNMQEIGEQDAAFNQIIFGSVVLSVLAHAPQWFPELGDAQAEAEAKAAAAAPAPAKQVANA